MKEKFRSRKEIEKKIEEVKAERNRLPQFSLFGDDNWAQIDAQVEILNTALEKGEPAIEALSSEIEDEIPEDNKRDLWNSKRDVIAWLFGHRWGEW